MSKFNLRRHFAIRAKMEKKAETEQNTVLLQNGTRVEITPTNAKFAETIKRKDAERAYEQAVMGRLAA